LTGTPPIARAIAGLALAVFGWGITWPINKVLLAGISPFWLSAFRSAIACVVLFAIAVATRRLILPTRHDMPMVVSIALLHMVGFSVLAAIGLSLVPVGRSVVLAYTTPLWVIPAAAIFLRERVTGARLAGLALGLAGLVVLFNPFAFDWSDSSSIGGHAALLVAALLWAANMVHVRGHQWRATPFQLVPWEMLLAAAVLFVIAVLSGATLAIDWNAKFVVLLLASSILGQALPQWAVVVAGRGLSAGTVSLGLLASPIIGIVGAAVALGEPLDFYVWLAVFLVIGGVALGTMGRR
jgi:drug/metabolite transporter (DMT)-like permease